MASDDDLPGRAAGSEAHRPEPISAKAGDARASRSNTGEDVLRIIDCHGLARRRDHEYGLSEK